MSSDHGIYSEKSAGRNSSIISIQGYNNNSFKAKAYETYIKARDNLIKYAKFVGPGVMVSIAYMDPGNYSTDVSAGASLQYSLLFVILLANFVALFFQSLAIKLGCVTGNDLAVACRQNFPRWLTIILYILAEAAIVCTDMSEVIGTAIALNILLKIPLLAGVAITIVDVMLILLAYRPGKGMKAVRIFEYIIAGLVMGIVICFAVELSRIPKAPAGQVFRGYLPSREVFVGQGLYLACGIMGATVMPHSLYLGSALVRPRLREFDINNGYINPEEAEKEDIATDNDKYRPSLQAIKYAMRISIFELVIALSTTALFVNSSILIVSGATLYNQPGAAEADLYGIYDMLGQLVNKAAGIVFMLALLLSGQSAGIICTIAGQIVSEGHMKWKFKPWLRRIITRLVAILPCMIVAGCVGQNGLNQALNASQVALSILLPFLTAPLIYLTCQKRVMVVTVQVPTSTSSTTTVTEGLELETGTRTIVMANGIKTKIGAITVWLFIATLNVYLIVHLAMG